MRSGGMVLFAPHASLTRNPALAAAEGINVPISMNCSSCGRELSPHLDRCSGCGAPARRTQLPTQLPLDEAVTRMPAEGVRLKPGGRASHAKAGVQTPPSPRTPVLGEASPPTHGSEKRGVHSAGPLAIGESFGRYHISRLLGVGGMGVVYQAWDDELGTTVAIKVIRPEITDDPRAADQLERRFKRELVLARQVTHRNVVRRHGVTAPQVLRSLILMRVAWSRETEDRRNGRGGGLEARSTKEGGELARPEPTGGKGRTSGRPD